MHAIVSSHPPTHACYDWHASLTLARFACHSHLIQSCQHIPYDIREDLKKLRERKDNACGGKTYWADGCKALGVVEMEDGLFFDRLADATTVATTTEVVEVADGRLSFTDSSAVPTQEV
jgi:hypothetical protein